MKPLIREFPYTSPEKLFAAFARQEGAIFLDGVCQSDYSFIAIDPFLQIACKNGVGLLQGGRVMKNPFEVLAKELSNYTFEKHDQLPPFQGGAAGYLSYDCCQYLEKITLQLHDDVACPDMVVGFYDLVIAFDHVLRKAWIFSSGFPEIDFSNRKRRAQERLAWIEQQLDCSVAAFPKTIGSHVFIHSNFTQQEYELAVAKTKDYITAGDIFEANIAQRFTVQLPASTTAYTLYNHLRQINPAPFAAFLNVCNTVIASSSPERFLRVDHRHVETRPIKGTAKRGTAPEEEERIICALENSIKDRAENIMIVDLMRNDLSRVCKPASVKVDKLCGVETFATVHHLVSVISGELSNGKSCVDLLRATFPGGSITGAPKIRAMEIIAEIEPVRRGPYCGSIFYLGFDGGMDSSIIIRTYVIKDNMVTFHAGGAIVSDSEPVNEYKETLTKAYALLSALQL